MALNSANKLRLLSCIGRYQPVCRAELSRLTNLPSPTITNIVADLIEQGLVSETGFQISTGGRKPALLELCPDRYYTLGVELNAQMLTVLLMDLRANIYARHVETVEEYSTQDVLIERLLKAIEKCLKEKAELKPRLSGIGIGVSGLVDSQRGISIRFPGISAWNQLPLVDLLKKQFNLPTFLENNVTMRTLAELWYGLGRTRNNFLLVSLGPHIRMGIVIEGRLFRGMNGNAGELGHITYKSDGPLCYCGNFGCLEGYASATALVREARKVLQEPAAVSGSPLAGIARDQLNSDQIFDAAREGDRLANSILDRILEPLGLGLSSLVNLFDAEAIILGGPMALQADLILDRLRQTIQKRSLPHLASTVALEATAFGPEGGALGGGALIMQKMFEGVIPIQ